uniref:Uncharacterized protein n=1 Tax=Caenorhabditis japonica TaxID=281687 RepID=A0A8R1ET94_CAEJA
MFPIISKEADRIADEDVENCRKVIIHYDQELGGCPIVMKIANKDEEDLLKAIKQRVISADLRHDHSVQLFRRDSENTSNDLPKYVDEHYVMKLSRDDGKEVEFKKRFVITEEMESELKGDMLKWNDVAGGDGRMKVLSRKRTRDNDQNPDEVAECQLKTVKVEG